MVRAPFSLVLLLFASAVAMEQVSPSPQMTESTRPCALHPVNGRMCVSEEVLRALLLRYIAPKLPENADENGEVVLHVKIPATGGKATKISVISGDPALTRSAIRAVREWIFIAYLYKHDPMAIEGDLHIRFKAAG